MTDVTMNQWATLPVGDSRRPALGRAIVGTLAVAVVFLVYIWVAKEIRFLYAHTPWANDPFDAIISFAFFFVPLTAGLCFLRVPLCLRAEPLPLRRARDLLRVSRIILAVVSVTLLSEWVSVLLRENRSTWTAVTTVLVSVLAVLTAATVSVAIELVLAFRQIAETPSDSGPEWVSDIRLTGERFSSQLGPAGSVARRILAVVDQRVTPAVRAHPLAATGALSVAFGVVVAASQAFGEGSIAWRTLALFMTVSACSMFAFVLAVGLHLGLLGHTRSIQGASRRMVDAVVVGVATVPVTLAFRTALRSLVVGSLGSGHMLQVAILIALAAAALVFTAETVTRRHG